MRDKLVQKELLFKAPRIKACALWDTVAALSKNELSFVDQKIPLSIELAVHALALNEKRTQYAPLLWHEDAGRIEPSRLHQCWFLGSHSDVGGGNSYSGLANIAFAWVINYLESLVRFSEDAIFDITQNYEAGFDLDPPRSWFSDKGNGHYRLTLNLSIQEFQSKTDTHVGWFAFLQRITGWGPRQVLSSGNNAHERVHWSVETLLKKKIVGACDPLSLIDAAHRPIESSGELERRVLATWIARQLREVLLRVITFRLSEESPVPGSAGGSAHYIKFSTHRYIGSSGQVFEDPFGLSPDDLSSLALAAVPIYAVLWPLNDHSSDLWSVVTEDIYAPYVSVKIDGNAETDEVKLFRRSHKDRKLGPWDMLGKEYTSPTSTLTLLARFRRWLPIPRAILTLKGHIDIPFTQSDLTGNDDIQNV